MVTKSSQVNPLSGSAAAGSHSSPAPASNSPFPHSSTVSSSCAVHPRASRTRIVPGFTATTGSGSERVMTHASSVSSHISSAMTIPFSSITSVVTMTEPGNVCVTANGGTPSLTSTWKLFPGNADKGHHCLVYRKCTISKDNVNGRRCLI